MIRTVIHQPDFLPWIGFFDKIQKVDQFIILDDVQFSRRGWTHRDKIKINNNFKWLTIPVKKKNKYHQLIRDVQIEDIYSTKKNHINLIKEAYKESNNFEEIFPSLQRIYNKNYNYLIDLNIDLIKLFCELLQIDKKYIFSSRANVTSKSSERLIQLLKFNNSNKYLTGEPSKDYINLKLFKKNQIDIIWHTLDYNKYQKSYKNFDPELSALDFLMNKK